MNARQSKPKTNSRINFENLFLELESDAKIKEREVESRPQFLLRMLRDDPQKIAKSKELYREFMETFLYIKPKDRGVVRFEMNSSQEVLFDAYFIMKEINPFIRFNILKGRQQGMSTLIGAIAIVEMLLYPGTGAMIASENQTKSGKNIFRMYELFLNQFQEKMQEALPENEWLWGGEDIAARFSFGEECTLVNESLFDVVGETAVTSKTLQFIHLSEAAFFHHLDDCLGMMLQTLPREHGTSSSMFIETTAKEYGNAHHDGWLASCEGKASFKPIFLPWYVHKTYAHKFDNDAQKKNFEENIGEADDHKYGNERSLLSLDNRNAPWRLVWDGKLDFEGYGYDKITLENLKFRRSVIDDLFGNLNEFNRQYPSTPEMAFLSNSSHVLDMEAVRWYVANQQKEPKSIGMIDGYGTSGAVFREQRGGIIATWEDPFPHREYIIGVDVAEGMDTGDFSCAYVISRIPFKIVARLRGVSGRAVRLEELINQLNYLGRYYNNATICVENNGSGMAVTEGLMREGYPNQIAEGIITLLPGDRLGWRNTSGASGTRDRGVSFLQEMITNKQMGIPCSEFLSEAFHFHFVGGKPQAARKGQQSKGSTVGCYDDCMFAVISALLANNALEAPKTEIEHMQQAEQQKIQVEKERNRRDSQKWTDYRRFV